MPQPAQLYYVIETTIGISKGASGLIVLVSDGLEARRAELKVANTQDPDTQVQSRLQSLWASGEPATMQEYRQAVQRADNPLLNDIVDAIAVAISYSATPAADDILNAVQGVVGLGTPRYDELMKLTNMFKSMTNDQKDAMLAVLTLILLSKSQQT